jgi:hypothetical protein
MWTLLSDNPPAAERDLADYNLKKSFYGRLFREGELLWERKAGLLPILQPHIRLYYLPAGRCSRSRTHLGA